MKEEHILPTEIVAQLADSLKKREALNIADGAADLGDDHIDSTLLRSPLHSPFDLIGNMRNHLDSLSQVEPFPLPLDYRPVDLAGSNIVFFG